MAWIEAHQGLVNHPKTKTLASIMGWDKFGAVGRLLAFWSWCFEYAPTGDLSRWNNALIAESVELNATESKAFVEAMVESGWICREPGLFRVHDWIDYASRYLRDTKFKRHPDKWAEVQRLYSIKCHCGGVSRQSADSPPIVGCTLPDLTEPKTPPTPPNGGKAGVLDLKGNVKDPPDPSPVEAWEIVLKSFDERFRSELWPKVTTGTIRRTIELMGGYSSVFTAYQERSAVIRGQFMQYYRSFRGEA